MNGKCKLTDGCKVVAIMDGEFFDAEMSDVEAGETFQYRGESPEGVHQFAPDWERHPGENGLVGFQVPESDMEGFYQCFRVLAPDNL